MSTTESAPTTGSTAVDPRAERMLRTLGVAMVIALLAELLLGMANAFWLSVPESGSGWKTASPQALLSAHVLLGIAIAVLGVWIAVAAWRRRSRGWLLASAAGIAGILAGFGGGSAFMGDVSNDTASFIMAAGCAVSIGAYAVGAALIGRSAAAV